MITNSPNVYALTDIDSDAKLLAAGADTEMKFKLKKFDDKLDRSSSIPYSTKITTSGTEATDQLHKLNQKYFKIAASQYSNNKTPLTSSTTTTSNTDVLAGLVKQYGVSKRNALMKWCQERLINYKGVDIKNFSSSWNDGLAFCALMHTYFPNKIDYEQLRQENNPVTILFLF
jgi:hypothetical protein